MSQNNAPAPPDYSGIIAAQTAAARESQALAQEQFAWAKQTYAENKGVTDRVVESFLDAQETNQANAVKDRERYETIFQPLEDDLAAEARDYATPERKEKEMGRAQANVAQQFGAARLASQRELESFGINPGASRFAALDIGIRAQPAAAAAGAGNQASEAVDATERALRSEAINVGRGYPGQIAGAYGSAAQGGQGANGNMLSTTASGANTMGTGVQWNSAANAGWNGASNTMNNSYKNQMSSYEADQKNGWGQVLGTVLGAGASLATQAIPRSSIAGRLFAASGGAVEDGMDGGTVPEQVSPSRGKAVDDVDAAVSVGEFIMPKDAVSWYGEKHFYGLIDKANKDREEMKQTTGAVPTIHPSAMGVPGESARRQAVEV